jgi:hypothetical protein
MSFATASIAVTVVSCKVHGGDNTEHCDDDDKHKRMTDATATHVTTTRTDDDNNHNMVATISTTAKTTTTTNDDDNHNEDNSTKTKTQYDNEEAAAKGKTMTPNR